MYSFKTLLFIVLGIALVRGATFKLYGLDYTARRINYCPSQAQVNQDMQIIDSLANYVRIYSMVDCNQGAMILQAIKDLNLPLRVTLGIWLDIYFYAEFPNEYTALQNLNNAYGLSKVDSIIVGSETQYRGDFPVNQLIGYINNISTTIKQEMGYPQIQVTTADVIDEMSSHPALIAAVDYVAYNEFAFWENYNINNAVQHTIDRYNNFVRFAQGKRIVISEAGWPSEGEAQGNSVPSFSNENTFFQGVVCWAASNNIPLYYFAAFDSLWQTDDDQKHWGLYNEDRSLKTGISLDFPCSAPSGGSTGTSVTQAPPKTTSSTSAASKASTTKATTTTKASVASTTKTTTTGKATSIAATRATSTAHAASTSTAKAASTSARSSSSKATTASSFSSASTTGSSTTGSSAACVSKCGSGACCETASGAMCYDTSSYECYPGSNGSPSIMCGLSNRNFQPEGVCNNSCYDKLCYNCVNDALQPTGNC